MAGLGLDKYNYSMNVPNQQDQYVDNQSTIGSKLVTGNSYIDGINAMNENQGLVDNSLDFIPGGRSVRAGSKLGRFDNEAAAMARSIPKDFVQNSGRTLRRDAQNRLNNSNLGSMLGIKKFDANKVPLSIRYSKAEDMGNEWAKGRNRSLGGEGLGGWFDPNLNEAVLPSFRSSNSKGSSRIGRESIREHEVAGHAQSFKDGKFRDRIYTKENTNYTNDPTIKYGNLNSKEELNAYTKNVELDMRKANESLDNNQRVDYAGHLNEIYQTGGMYKPMSQSLRKDSALAKAVDFYTKQKDNGGRVGIFDMAYDDVGNKFRF